MLLRYVMQPPTVSLQFAIYSNSAGIMQHCHGQDEGTYKYESEHMQKWAAVSLATGLYSHGAMHNVQDSCHGVVGTLRS